MEISRRRTESYFQRKEKFLQLFQCNELRTNQELREKIKLKLKNKHSITRIQIEIGELKGGGESPE